MNLKKTAMDNVKIFGVEKSFTIFWNISNGHKNLKTTPVRVQLPPPQKKTYKSERKPIVFVENVKTMVLQKRITSQNKSTIL